MDRDVGRYSILSQKPRDERLLRTGEVNTIQYCRDIKEDD